MVRRSNTVYQRGCQTIIMLRFKSNKIHLLLLSCLSATYAINASANITFQESKHIDPLLGLEFSSSVSSDYGYDDNVFNQNSDHIVGSNYYTIKPAFSITGHRYTKDFGLYYSGDYRKYTNDVTSYQGSSDQNYSDHNFNGIFKWEMGLRHHLELTANYGLGHEALGTGVTNGFYFDDNSPAEDVASFDNFQITKPIEKKDTDFAIKYSYGAKDAKGRIDFSVGQKRLRYDVLNSYSSTFQTYLENENLTESEMSLIFRHSYTHKTRFDYILMYRQYEYLDSTRDNEELLAGVSYISQITGKSKIEASITNVQKYMNTTDTSSINWSVMYKWQPVNYSAIVLKSASEVKEPDNTGDYIQSYINSISWNHEFLGNVSTQLSYTHIDDKYHIRDRNDDYDYLRLNVTYVFRPRVEFNFEYNYSVYNSSLNSDPLYINVISGPNLYGRNLGYEKNQFGLSIKVAI
ncbi:Capsular polysaccharide synthesis enzyme CpsB [Photobacterium damselae subsp. damselae CIP 102761]|uniref:Capsular polysaccharide synthesis enzyme CpsB n=2 Tax=Photobacterium damselae TaxID=38293 RepID=D0YZQ6_PHODD|nr:Capsular polysaccharide synthesis enzyme CpsB [Photobacterium damselae subsp. damselae CIP 102761]